MCDTSQYLSLGAKKYFTNVRTTFSIVLKILEVYLFPRILVLEKGREGRRISEQIFVEYTPQTSHFNQRYWLNSRICKTTQKALCTFSIFFLLIEKEWGSITSS